MAKRYVRKKKKGARRRRLLLLIILAAVLILALVIGISSCRKGGSDTTAPEGGGALWDGGWYEDDLGRIQNDRALVKGMKAFEKKTGAKPYLTLLDGIEPEELEIFAQDQYEALFESGDHVLVVYDEWEESAYALAGKTGENSTLTDEDVSRLLTCIEKAYADPANTSYEAAFGTGFAQAAEEMPASKQKDGAGLLLAMGIVLAVMSAVLIVLLRRRTRGNAPGDGAEG